MSSTKWIIAVIIIAAVLLGLWWGGFLGGTTPEAKNGQSATALSGTAETAVVIDYSDATIATESAVIDAQMKVAGNLVASFSQAPTAAKADLLSTQLGAVANLLSKLSERFKARVTNLKNAGFNTGIIQGALSDMILQISYASSQAGLGGQLAAKAKAEGTKNGATLQQVLIELQKSQTYLEAAQKDIKTIVQGFKSINNSQNSR